MVQASGMLVVCRSSHIWGRAVVSLEVRELGWLRRQTKLTATVEDTQELVRC